MHASESIKTPKHLLLNLFVFVLMIDRIYSHLRYELETDVFF